MTVIYIGVNRVGRTGTIKGNDSNQIFKTFRTKACQHTAHSGRFKLKNSVCPSAGKHFKRCFIVNLYVFFRKAGIGFSDHS